MKKPYYTIRIQDMHFSIKLPKTYAKYLYSFATHIEFALGLYNVDISFVSRESMYIKGIFNENESFKTAITEQIKYYFSNK